MEVCESESVTLHKNDNHRQKVKFATLGCRLNQYESQAMREQFTRAGFTETQDECEANVFVLNTCTVTSESDRLSRYLIRKFHRENPEAKIVVTGCYVEKNEAEIKAIPGVTLTVLNRQKSEIVDLLESCTSFSFAPFELPSKRRFTPLSISEFEDRTRAYVKIQDGCNHACSFCKVVLVRGPARSRPLDEVVEEVKRLEGQGFQEVVLTGIQLGAYGYDFGKRQMLVDLLETLHSSSTIKRIRLSSIEPTDVTEELIEAIAALETICPHLHIPLQSGDDEILARMNRRYRRDFYLDLIAKIRTRVPDFVLTADVMVGFHGESDLHFEKTVELLNETEPYQLHIFPYSVREGTRAARFQNRVDGGSIQNRRAALLALESKLRRRVQERFLGRAMDILTEEDAKHPGWAGGRARNYLKVRFPSHDYNPGRISSVRIERIENSELVGCEIRR